MKMAKPGQSKEQPLSPEDAPFGPGRTTNTGTVQEVTADLLATSLPEQLDHRNQALTKIRGRRDAEALSSWGLHGALPGSEPGC